MEFPQNNSEEPIETGETGTALTPDGLENEKKKDKGLPRWLWWGLAALVVLAGAGFLAGRLINRPAAKGGQGVYMSSGGPGGGTQSYSIDIKPSPDLPTAQADVTGVFVRREDKSLFVGTGNVSIAATVGDDGQPGEISADYDGPVVEVVVNHNTTIYKDATDFFNASSANTSIQQELKPGSVDDLKDNMVLSIWGQKQGDRIVADTLVYK